MYMYIYSHTQVLMTYYDSITVSCEAGSEPIGAQCTECAVGSYKESAGVDACVTCPDGQITDMTGSTSASDCKGG